MLRPCCVLKFQFWNILLYTHKKLVILSIQWHIASQKIPTLTLVKLRLKSAKNYDEGFMYNFFKLPKKGAKNHKNHNCFVKHAASRVLDEFSKFLG